MINHKKLLQDSSDFFIKEVDKVIIKVAKAKNPQTRDLYIKQMEALKLRLELELKMVDIFGNE
jgi:G:T/U-mismatch repair DNA glycosylase